MRSTFSHFHIYPVSQKPPPPRADGSAHPSTSVARSPPSSCCFGLVKQLLSDPAFPPLCHPRSRAPRSPPPSPSTCAQEPTHVTDRCVSRCLWGGLFRPREARRRCCGVLTSQLVVLNQSGSIWDSLRFPWNSVLVRLQDTFFLIFFVCVCVEF